MAIKGKSKTRSKSGAQRRRPAAPPRPTVVTPSRAPWYRTMTGQLAAIVFLLAIIGVVMWRVEAARSESEALEDRQEELAKYTSEIEGYVTAVQPTIREMLGAAFNTANPEALAALGGSTDGWFETLESNAALVQSVVPPEDLVAANVALQQAFSMYSSSAKLYGMVPGEQTDRKIQELLDRAREVRDQAGVVMGSALGMLDQARGEAEMAPSGIDVPAQLTPILPTPSPVEGAKNSGKDSGKGKKNDG